MERTTSSRNSPNGRTVLFFGGWNGGGTRLETDVGGPCQPHFLDVLASS